MAEAIWLVSSIITVVGVAGKLGISVIKLRKLWDEVQDVPESIHQLIIQLELLKPVLAQMEAEFINPEHGVNSSTALAANMSLQYCVDAVGNLETLVEDLGRQVSAAKKSKRSYAKFKVTFKKDVIKSYQEKIQFSLQVLSFLQKQWQHDRLL
ncbi:hypothetical protein CTRI78_v007600 [Colletotrichum trifolii]|uniref:Azaphilone pigments biosynthesis cluster protein L N-terminal domain-containing protein n=1 Tax=Colletotrichum trifolii TaxID=5466 RepID=A0A4R8R6F7_COLTR|nr:hypothetical protein CTRI78_v007600 [Colletotrichum trifolii]